MRGVLHDHIELKGVTWLHEKPEIVDVSYIDIKDRQRARGISIKNYKVVLSPDV
jgi:hypothetical protein